ncbi:hypothetical protein BVH03_17945 [Pseudomonas sp. PA15(2017)]|uniref:hypothetical protein n=1 Tax=Pseudomonas sp. PA15(2017) TaxID=1932111 RepID=UPI0009678944|nr:hypothetical protein [Pseudomonas sp. PA15(2017)]OLU25528.1 hypothetical protein BVH03_17945 [Pseudomonas sp. PA15(2017)]
MGFSFVDSRLGGSRLSSLLAWQIGAFADLRQKHITLSGQKAVSALQIGIHIQEFGKAYHLELHPTGPR